MSIVVGPKPYGQAAMNFIAGTGAANREAKLMNRRQQAQQQMMMSQAIGQAVGDVGSAYFQPQIYKAQLGLQTGARNWLGAQDDARRMSMLNREAEIQSAYSQQRHQQAMDEFSFEKTGTTPEALMNRAVYQADSSAPAPQNYVSVPSPAGYDIVGPPATAIGGGAPMAPMGGDEDPRYANPPKGYKYEYSPAANMQLANYDAAIQALASSKKYSPEEKIRGTMTLANERGQIRKNLVPEQPMPMMPGPDGQLVPAQFGWNEAPPRPGMIMNSDGELKPYTPPSKGAPVNYADMDPIQQQAYRIGAVGGQEQYEAIKARGGTVLVNPADGKVSIDYPKAGAAEKPVITYKDARTQALKELQTKDMFGGTKVVDPKAIDKRAREIVQEAGAATPGAKNSQVEADKATVAAILAKGFRTDEDNRILAEIEARSAGR